MSSNAPPSRHSKIGREEFCRACGRFATGVAVATVLDKQGTPHGMTVNSFSSVSISPPLVLFCVAHTARMLEHFRAQKHLAINILREEQRALSTHFARAGHDGFTGVEWEPGPNGVPLIPDALAVIECELHRTIAAGDHDIVIAEVVHTTVREGRPLLYYASKYRVLE